MVYFCINNNNYIEKNGVQYVIVKVGSALSAKVARYIGNDKNVVIPSTIEVNGKIYNVTGVGKHAFIKCSSLTSITIPESVTSIGQGAFSGCSSLKSITIPRSVTSIGQGAFSGCSSLTSITIPNSVIKIGYSVFLGCSQSLIIKIIGYSNKPSGWDKDWNLRSFYVGFFKRKIRHKNVHWAQ